MSTRLEPGTKAPSFTLEDYTGQQYSLADYAGHKVILYFYPKASTPGCTKEACDFQDNLASLKALGYIVLGVSPDKPAALEKFTAKESLTFPPSLRCRSRRRTRLRCMGRKEKLRQSLRRTYPIYIRHQ